MDRLTNTLGPAPDTQTMLAAFDWPQVLQSLDERGHAVLPRLLDEEQCAELIAGYDDDLRYRSRIVMARHGFGRGEYRYFAYPLPTLIAGLRRDFYTHLAPVADVWRERLGGRADLPATHREYLARCHAAGQHRPTPLILRYGPGDYNCLHQDLYGQEVFPLQIAILLAEPGRDFEGGEFVMTATGSAGQRAEVLPLRRGDALIFAVNDRPVPGRRPGRHKAVQTGVQNGTQKARQGGQSWRRVRMRHGVSALRRGSRYTLGLILHDAA